MKNYLVKIMIHSIWILFISINSNAQYVFSTNVQSSYCGITVGNQAGVVTIATDGILVMPARVLDGFADLSNLANSIGATVIHTYQMGLEHWALPSGGTWVNGTLLDDVWDFIHYLNNQSIVDFAEPNYILSLSSDDPYLVHQWPLNGLYMSSIDARECWNVNPGYSDRIIGLIDSGVDWGHVDLVQNNWQNMGEDIDGDGRVLELINGKWVFDPDDVNGIDDDGNGYVDDFIGWDFVNDDNDPKPQGQNNNLDSYGNNNSSGSIDSHGTHVAGIIAAKGNNDIGIAGVHWNAQLMSLKCFDTNGQGTVSDIIKALEYSFDKDVKITNNSYGGSTCSNSLYMAIGVANEEGQLFVTAAGNNQSNNDVEYYFPANYDHPNIVTVMSINQNEAVSINSNYGSINVDIGAPGEDIYAPLPGNSYGYKTGTSMATPHVTGALALLWDRMSDLTHLEIKERILCYSEAIPALQGKCISNGYLNLGNINGYDVNAAIGISNLCSNVASACMKIDPVLSNASYTWYFDSGHIAYGSNPPYYAYYGNSVCVDVVTSCGDFHQICTRLPVAKTDNEFSNIDIGTNMIYPNPVKDFINVNYTFSGKCQVSIALYNTSGQLIKTLLTDYKTEEKSLFQRFNLSDLQSGIYLLLITDDNNSYYEKIYKE